MCAAPLCSRTYCYILVIKFEMALAYFETIMAFSVSGLEEKTYMVSTAVLIYLHSPSSMYYYTEMSSKKRNYSYHGKEATNACNVLYVMSDGT